MGGLVCRLARAEGRMLSLHAVWHGIGLIVDDDLRCMYAAIPAEFFVKWGSKIDACVSSYCRHAVLFASHNSKLL